MLLPTIDLIRSVHRSLWTLGGLRPLTLELSGSAGAGTLRKSATDPNPTVTPRLHEDVELRGHGLSQSYGQGATRSTVLHEVTLTLRRRELVMVKGPSGSGKSTLLAVLSGLLQPEKGKVLVLGHDLWQMSTAARKQFRQRHFGFIFQGYNLFPALTASQQLEIVLRWSESITAKAAKDRANRILQVLGLGEKGGLRPAQLSGGEKQRVAIGRALIKEPEFIFADEPTSALDWKHGKHVVELLRNAATVRGASVFVVSHDSRIEPYADRVMHLEDGRVCEQERAADLAGSSTP